jgi:D-beta-D-heptose 7-phosphate kinase / D-beta-D-heptose 1-phosphate adenosyltransferase
MTQSALAPTHVADLIRDLPAGRVLVLGDAVLDEWIEGRAQAVAREAPVPAVDVTHRATVPGGAANSAANVASLGGQVQFLSVVGADGPGAALLRALEVAGVHTAGCFVQPGRATRRKRRLVADGQVVARFDEGDTDPVDERADSDLAARLVTNARAADVVVVADYTGGTLAGAGMRQSVARVAGQRPLVIDAHDVGSWREAHAAIVTPNWPETLALLAGGGSSHSQVRGSDRVEFVRAARRDILGRSGAATAVVTLDGDGAVILGPDGLAQHVGTTRVHDAHPAGAGDTLAATLALALAAGADLHAAVEVAVAAATVVVAQERTSVCRASDLLPRGRGAVLGPRELGEVCREHRRAGRRIAFTNGCFDVLHAGHVACLEAAARLGDVLVVGLNDDAGVRAIKGPGRPVIPLQDRAAVIAALGTVDHIVTFSGEAPMRLIHEVRPDVYVKGADHDVESLPEARLVRRLGGRVVTLPLLPDRSTSGLIAACAAASPGRAP